MLVPTTGYASQFASPFRQCIIYKVSETKGRKENYMHSGRTSIIIKKTYPRQTGLAIIDWTKKEPIKTHFT